jgi:hypothetical protein
MVLIVLWSYIYKGTGVSATLLILQTSEIEVDLYPADGALLLGLNPLEETLVMEHVPTLGESVAVQ